jgi:hypothetical protein
MKQLALTQVSCHLAIVTVKNDRAFVLSLLPLMALLLAVWQWLDLVRAVGGLLEAIGMAASIYVTVAAIIGKSLLWGFI